MRCFFCFELPDEVQRNMVEFYDSVNNQAHVKWVERSNLHITLKFLGNVEKSSLPKIKTRAQAAIENQSSFQINIDKLGCFPHMGFPKIIWFGSSSAPREIHRLHDQLEEQLNKLGFSKENRDYVPHVTLGRTKDKNNDKIKGLGEKLQNITMEESWKVTVNKLTLMESQLRSTGPIYSPVFHLSLDS